MAGVVLLGMALYGVLSHYAEVYIEATSFSARQEALVRAGLPLVAALAVWLLKAYQA
jgi:hypothetical protein